MKPPSARPESYGSGCLSLRFASVRGRTVLVESYAAAPFHVFAADRLGDGALVVQVTMLGPGIAAGDGLAQHILVGRGTHAIVLFTSANKVLGSPTGEAGRQDVRIVVDDGGMLEYYPGLTIPFPDAVFEQRMAVELTGDARFGLLELWAMGRVHRDEAFAFPSIDARTEVRLDNRPAYADALVLRPRAHSVDGLGLMEDSTYMASGYWRWDAPSLQLEKDDERMTLVTGVPAKGDVYLRGLAGDGLTLRKAIRDWLEGQRQAWGLEALDIERYAPAFA